MKTMCSEKLYACIETEYDQANGDDADVFVGTHDECLKWMRQRYKTMSKSMGSSKERGWIDSRCGLGRGVLQGDCGQFRYEWWIVIPKVKV